MLRLATRGTGQVRKRIQGYYALVLTYFRIYLSNPLLSKGIVLVDIPGVSDSNVLRVNTARSYLRKCDHVIIVGNIERATDDQGIKKLLREVVDRKRYERVALALTRSDVSTFTVNNSD